MLSGDVVKEGLGGSLGLRLSIFRAIPSSGVSSDNCVGERGVDLSLTRATVMNSLVSIWSLLFSQPLPGLLVLYGFSVDGN